MNTTLATVAAHFVLTLSNTLRLRTLRGETVTVPAGETVKYATLADGSMGLRLADGRGVKVEVMEWRRALASGESVDGWLVAALALRVKSTDERKRRNSVLARLVALGYAEACGRCGGEGRYSYCTGYGSTCFSCGGAKQVALRITHDLLEDAENRVNAGELDGYLTEIARKSAALRAIKPLVATITKEWREGAVHTSYRAIDRRTVDSGVIVASAEFRAADLINNVWKAANDAERGVEFDRVDATVAVERLNDCLAMVRTVNAAWSAYDGADRLTK